MSDHPPSSREFLPPHPPTTTTTTREGHQDELTTRERHQDDTTTTLQKTKLAIRNLRIALAITLVIHNVTAAGAMAAFWSWNLIAVLFLSASILFSLIGVHGVWCKFKTSLIVYIICMITELFGLVLLLYIIDRDRSSCQASTSRACQITAPENSRSEPWLVSHVLTCLVGPILAGLLRHNLFRLYTLTSMHIHARFGPPVFLPDHDDDDHDDDDDDDGERVSILTAGRGARGGASHHQQQQRVVPRDFASTPEQQVQARGLVQQPLPVLTGT